MQYCRIFYLIHALLVLYFLYLDIKIACIFCPKFNKYGKRIIKKFKKLVNWGLMPMLVLILIGKDFWEMGSNTSTFKLGREITPLIEWVIFFKFYFYYFSFFSKVPRKTFLKNNTTASVFLNRCSTTEREAT